MKRLPSRLVLPLYSLAIAGAVAVALIPTASSARGTWNGLSLAAVIRGIAALAALLLQFISSGRWERLFGALGLDRTLNIHTRAAWAVLLAVLLHPLLLLDWSPAASSMDRLEQLSQWLRSPTLRSGSVSLGALVMLLVLAGLRRRLPIRYELWRGSHTVLAITSGTAAVHHGIAMANGNSIVLLLWLSLAAMTIGTLAYVYLFKPMVLRRRLYTLSSNREVAPGVRELQLQPTTARCIPYQAGQFGWISFARWPTPLTDHPYSFASSPLEGPMIRLLIKARGDFSSTVDRIPPGAITALDAPHGNFCMDDGAAPAVTFVAGGIGIAPILGILRDLAMRRDPRPIALVFGARLPELLVGRDEIESLKRSLDLVTVYSAEHARVGFDGSIGTIDLAGLGHALRAEDPRQTLCFVCGPTPMMDAAIQRLMELGVPARRIVAERFDFT